MQSVDYTFPKLQKVGKVVGLVFTKIWIKSGTKRGEWKQTRFPDRSTRPILIQNKSLSIFW